MGIAADPAVADHGSAPSMANGKRPHAATPATPSPQRWRRSTTNRTPVPDDFVLTEAQWAWAAREVPGLDVERETKKFLNHFRGTGDRKADWGATWRNWMYRAQEFQGRRSPPPQARNGLVL
jgi:hypothetical protein